MHRYFIVNNQFRRGKHCRFYGGMITNVQYTYEADDSQFEPRLSIHEIRVDESYLLNQSIALMISEGTILTEIE